VLTSFQATRSGNNTLITWTTASEQNNKGFGVEVSTDGISFRSIGFVASQNANSTHALAYKFTDTEGYKKGKRYYRLLQTDLDGKEGYSPVRVVNFDGIGVTVSGLAPYPNPFTDKLSFNIDVTAVGNGVAHVQLLDLTGRVVREQNLNVQDTSLTLEGLNGLRTGLYIARITLPDGSSQTARVQKQ